MLLVGVWVNRNWILGNWIREVQARGKEWSSLYWLPSVLANKHWLEKFLKPPLPKVDAYFFSYLSIFERYLEKSSHYENRSIILYTHNDPELGTSEHQVEILNRAFSVHFYCSRDAEKLVALGLKQEKVRVALCAVDVDCVRDHKILREPKTVVLASKYGSRKGLESFPELVAAMPDWKFLILGRDWEDFLAKNNLDKNPNIEYFRFSKKTRNEVMSRASVFLSLSNLEGGPVPLIEAMALGVAPVATNTGFARDVILRNDAGFIIPINESVLKIKEAITSAALLQGDISGAVSHLTWDRIAKLTFEDLSLITAK